MEQERTGDERYLDALLMQEEQRGHEYKTAKQSYGEDKAMSYLLESPTPEVESSFSA